MLIMIADDMPMNRQAGKRALRKAYPDAEFIEASTGEEVQELIEQGKQPDLIICDQHFSEYTPRAKGSDVIRWLREERQSEIPAVLFTSDLSAAQSLKTEWKVACVGSVAGLSHAVKSLMG